MGAELNKALAAFQAEIPQVAKRLTADMGTFKSDYAPLEDVVAAAMPLLGKHGLSLMTRPTLTGDGRFILSYSLLHASGEREDGDYPLPERGKPQELGSALTYARRYILCAVTGVAPGGEDDDGKEASKAKAAPRQQRPPSRPTADPVRSKVTGPDHERHRYGTVEATPDDRPAQRGPVPPDQDHWAGQPAGELPKKVNGTIGAIQQHFKRLHVTDRDVRLGYTAQLAQVNGLTSTNDLGDEDAKRVLAQLGKCRNREALDALLDRGDAPAEATT
jgi:hypothetical protein